MSLINDALRRKNEENKGPTQEKSDGAPMQPVQPTSGDNGSNLKMILVVLIVLVLLLAAFLFWKGFETKRELAIAAQSQTPHQPAPVAPVESNIVVPPPTPPPVPVAVTIEPSNAVATVLSQDANPVVAAPPAPPPLKLQGIFYRPSDPTVMINGKTVGVGEVISGARVLKIERQEVTLERDGKTETLKMD